MTKGCCSLALGHNIDVSMVANFDVKRFGEVTLKRCHQLNQVVEGQKEPKDLYRCVDAITWIILGGIAITNLAKQCVALKKYDLVEQTHIDAAHIGLV